MKKRGTATDIQITTTQKVLVGVALLASVGAFAAGFAAIPAGKDGKGKCDGKGCETMQLLKTSQVKTHQYTTQQPKTAQAVQLKQVQLVPGSEYVIMNSSSTMPLGNFYYAQNKKFYLFGSDSVMKTWEGSYQVGKGVVPYTQYVANGLTAGWVVPHPGTLFKFDTIAELFIMGRDMDIHRVSTLNVAKFFFGSDWNTKLVSIPTGGVDKAGMLVNYGMHEGIAVTEQNMMKLDVVGLQALKYTIEKTMGIK